MTSNVISLIFDLFARYGSLHYGEDASQLQHALQTAALARNAGHSNELIAAALLHDIGQLMNDAGNAAEQRGVDARHEIGGANFLRDYFPAAVYEPVRLHVAAKRYLCAIDPSYLQGLSHASALSLKLQGGPMNAAQRRAFEAEPFFKEAVALRRFDDTGKDPNRVVPDLDSYRSLLTALLV